ncbi:MAG: hypothetical protein QNJ47_26620 [Nostocaceae cyanobacterium]|nr:hypothetical protein [Nostocaceae cyanobacterium]
MLKPSVALAVAVRVLTVSSTPPTLAKPIDFVDNWVNTNTNSRGITDSSGRQNYSSVESFKKL